MQVEQVQGQRYHFDVTHCYVYQVYIYCLTTFINLAYEMSLNIIIFVIKQNIKNVSNVKKVLITYLFASKKYRKYQTFMQINLQLIEL